MSDYDEDFCPCCMSQECDQENWHQRRDETRVILLKLDILLDKLGIIKDKDCDLEFDGYMDRHWTY
jgi:hypothetical protein